MSRALLQGTHRRICSCSAFSSGTCAHSATRSSTLRMMSVSPRARNVPKLVRMSSSFSPPVSGSTTCGRKGCQLRGMGVAPHLRSTHHRALHARPCNVLDVFTLLRRHKAVIQERAARGMGGAEWHVLSALRRRPRTVAPTRWALSSGPASRPARCPARQASRAGGRRRAALHVRLRPERARREGAAAWLLPRRSAAPGGTAAHAAPQRQRAQAKFGAAQGEPRPRAACVRFRPPPPSSRALSRVPPQLQDRRGRLCGPPAAATSAAAPPQAGPPARTRRLLLRRSATGREWRTS